MKLSQERTKKSKRLKTKGSRLVLHSMDRVANSPACTKSLLADQIDSDTETLQPNQRQAKKLRKKIKRAGAQMKAKGKIVKVCTYLFMQYILMKKVSDQEFYPICFMPSYAISIFFVDYVLFLF